VSDVVTVALATGGFSLATAGIGAIVTTRVNRRTSDAAVATAHEQGATELAKLRVELEDTERLRRDAAYRQLIETLNRLDSYGTGSKTATDEQLNYVLDRYVSDLAAVLLLGTTEVQAVLDSVRVVVYGVQAEAEEATENVITLEAWKVAYGPRRDEYENRIGNLIDAMRDDIYGREGA
jgi:hypothetical protein